MNIAESRPAKKRFAPRLLRWFVALTLPLICLVGGVWLTCLFRNDLVVSLAEERLRSATGLDWRITGKVMPSFDPAPGVSVEGLVLPSLAPREFGRPFAEPPLLHVEKAVVRLNVSELFHGRLRLGPAELVRPVISLVPSSPAGGHPVGPSASSPPPQAAAGGSAPSANGTAPAQTAAPAAEAPPLSREDAAANAADVLARYSEFARTELKGLLPPLHLSNGELRRLNAKGEVFFTLHDLDVLLDFNRPEYPLRFSAAFDLPPADLTIRFTGEADTGKGDEAAHGRFSGSLGMTPPGSRTISAEFSSSVFWVNQGKTVSLPDFRLDAEGDSLGGQLSVNLQTMECTGPVKISRLSLPRWFKFGRILPSGLQHPLHDVRGGFSLLLTPNKAEALALRGTAGELQVSGYVGCPDFSKPVVVVDLSVPEVNLDMVLPFLAVAGAEVPDPPAPEFTMPWLAPYPGAEAGSGSDAASDDLPDVSYSVRVRAEKPTVHAVPGGPVEVKVYPANKDISRVSFSCPDIMGGGAEGKLDFYDRKVLMEYTLKKVQLAGLPENNGSPLRVAGNFTGTGEIEIKVDKEGSWAKVWSLKAKGDATDFSLSGPRKNSWKLGAATVAASLDCSIDTVLSKGVKLDGLWSAKAQGVTSSWNPKGKDTLDTVLTGALAWPPQAETPPKTASGKKIRSGLARISGDLKVAGVFTSPLGGLLVPVKGNLETQVDYNLSADTLKLDGIRFEGHGGFTTGSLLLNASGKEVTLAGPFQSRINPRVLLRDWNLLPGGVQMPEVVNGKTDFDLKGETLRFKNIDLQSDGAPLKGEVTGYFGAAAAAKQRDADGAPGASHWVIRASSPRLDIDRFLPPADPNAPPAPSKPLSKTPWNFKALQGISLDVGLTLENCKLRGLNLKNVASDFVLQRGRFSLHSQTKDFYGGSSSTVAQGILLPQDSRLCLNRLTAAVQGADFGKILYDMFKDTGYGGTLALSLDAKGNMCSDAEAVENLAGVWNVSLSDGMYPALVGSERMRSAFGKAGASGTLQRGLLEWDNFRLSGPMVEMAGKGKVDLVEKNLNVDVTVTLAGVPSVPVNIHGPLSKPETDVHGVKMVVNTAANAGAGVFGLVKGILSLPIQAVGGVGDLLKKPEKPKTPESSAAPLPGVTDGNGKH